MSNDRDNISWTVVIQLVFYVAALVSYVFNAVKLFRIIDSGEYETVELVLRVTGIFFWIIGSFMGLIPT